MAQEQEQEQEHPVITISFAHHQSAEMKIEVRDCSPFQMWGAARTLEQYATDQWQAIQMQQAMQAAQQQAGIVPVRRMPKGSRGRN